MRAFLTSIKLDGFSELVPAGATVAFIPTAADLESDRWFVEADRSSLTERGFKLREVSLAAQIPESLLLQFENVQAIYVTGGNSFYLLAQMRASGFDKILPDLLRRDVLYAGASAGACVAGKSIEPLKYLDDPSEAPNLSSYEGLGLVDFVILPHFGKEKYKPKFDRIAEEYKDKFKLVSITDEQSIIVRDNDWKIV